MIDDQPRTVDPMPKLVIAAKRVNLLRCTSQQDETGEVSTVRGKEGHFKTFDPSPAPAAVNPVPT
ncbi:MAG: hypothetical protein ACM4D3_21490 [Candidatus Sericytochromatia bacterium]